MTPAKLLELATGPPALTLLQEQAVDHVVRGLFAIQQNVDAHLETALASESAATVEKKLRVLEVFHAQLRETIEAVVVAARRVSQHHDTCLAIEREVSAARE